MKRLAGLLALLLGAPLAAQWVPSTAGWQVAGVVSSGGSSGTVTTTGSPASGQVGLVSGATSITGDAGLTGVGTGTGFKLGIGTDVFLSRASSGLLLVEDGSGNARDLQARTLSFGTTIPGTLTANGTGYVLLNDNVSGASYVVFGAGNVYPNSVNTQDLGVVGGEWRIGRFGTGLYSPLLVSGPGKTGTNVAGTDSTIQAESGTGSATGSSIIFQTPTAGASGTTAQTQTTRITISEGQTIFDATARPLSYGGYVARGSTGIYLTDVSTVYGLGYYTGSLGYSNAGTGAVMTRAHLFANDPGTVITGAMTGASGVTTLTESSATGFAKLTYDASEAVSAEFLVRIKANDATDFQSLTSRVRVSSIRKATGNTISTVSVIGTDLLAESAGGSTLSCTFTITEGAAFATLNANCVSSLTQTTLNASFVAETVGSVRVDQL